MRIRGCTIHVFYANAQINKSAICFRILVKALAKHDVIHIVITSAFRGRSACFLADSQRKKPMFLCAIAILFHLTRENGSLRLRTK